MNCLVDIFTSLFYSYRVIIFLFFQVCAFGVSSLSHRHHLLEAAIPQPNVMEEQLCSQGPLKPKPYEARHWRPGQHLNRYITHLPFLKENLPSMIWPNQPWLVKARSSSNVKDKDPVKDTIREFTYTGNYLNRQQHLKDLNAMGHLIIKT